MSSNVEETVKTKYKIKFHPFKRVVFWLKCGFYKFKNWLARNTNTLFKRGTHIISGYMGSGKTLLVNKVVNLVDSKKYFFITNIPEFNQENVFHHDIWELFDENSQKYKLPTTDENGRKLYALILDEINLKFNKRLNKSKDYNNKFVGLIEMIITSRHQGIPRIYFIGQKLELQDSQLQSLFKYWHNIIYSKVKGIWQYYKKENKLVFAPKLINYETYRKALGDEYEFVAFEKMKIRFEDLTSYNTFGLKNSYEELPTSKRINHAKDIKNYQAKNN